ncbi:MAG TPA: 4'-phosphopantetheinyl transferase superfamily protein [Archangium sp.]|uniref:4'-phosphopantetheinyl transferase family protein n=1 Tax=Archangium sp. TaxID=1872627 RepID=UPI002E3466EA|nr:4'-phosphopantetheinyl transferase superfamily protein [Archangium sp.]HEX5749396.1 4'-phosphopantetheinyl transferase superfamily protein [Archangium sp.]
MQRTASTHPEGFTFLAWSGVGVGVLAERREDPLLQSFLSPGERVCLDERVLPQRRPEWLRGRHVCKQVVRELLGPELMMHRVEVLPGPQGEPQLHLPEGPGPLDVSLSHARTLSVAAVTARGRVGVDVEPLVPVEERLWHFFLSPAERARCEREPELALRLWVLKEALYKALRPPRPLPLRSLVPELGEGVLRLAPPFEGELSFTFLPLRHHLLAVVHS